MQLRVAIAALLAACVLPASPLLAQSGMRDAEQLLVPFSAEEWKRWKIGSQATRPNFTMVEYIPKEQAIASWDRMLTVQIFRNIPIRLPQFMGQLKATFETKQPCEHTKLQAVGSKKVNGYDTSLHWLICTRSKRDSKGEFTLMLGIEGRDALYLVQRAWRGDAYGADEVPLSKDELASWLGFIGKVQVCDTRTPEHACPKGLQRAQ
jgi:hypothetical protein